MPSMAVSFSCTVSSRRGTARRSASVYGCFGSAKRSRVGAVSTNRPPYITAIRSQTPATTPRACVMRMSASAVVGSSAMSSCGSQASAIAIMTRWRMPPENWWGYSSRRCAAPGMPTRSSASTARRRAARPLSEVCSSIASTSCVETFRNGFRHVIGSWKIIAMRLPRISRMRDCGRASTSSPSKVTRPSILPGGSGMSRMSAIVQTLLPQPDSPTMPSVCPGSSV
jgi:hypothetical protein